MAPEPGTGTGDEVAAPRLGFFGGTFDPPHVGHLIVAQDAVEELGLDRLLFVPARIPPHKAEEDFSPGRIRLSMVRAALEGNGTVDVSEVELDRDGPSYTVDTLRHFRELHEGAELFFLMGADQLAQLEGWKSPAEIGELAHLVVMAREGLDPEEASPPLDVEVRRIEVTRVDVSSTMVRERVREGRSVRYLVPEAVRRIMKEHRLYRDGKEGG